MSVQNDDLRISQTAVSQWHSPTKLLLGTGAITILVLASLAASDAYTRYQNGNIDFIHCDRGFQYYHDSVTRNGIPASDQYCYAEMLEKGNGLQQSLSEARNWYKKAYDQGLRIAKDRLCHPNMYEQKFGNSEEYNRFQDLFKDYAQYKHICCPTPPSGAVCSPPTCPWQKDYIRSSC